MNSNFTSVASVIAINAGPTGRCRGTLTEHAESGTQIGRHYDTSSWVGNDEFRAYKKCRLSPTRVKESLSPVSDHRTLTGTQAVYRTSQSSATSLSQSSDGFLRRELAHDRERLGRDILCEPLEDTVCYGAISAAEWIGSGTVTLTAEEVMWDGACHVVTDSKQCLKLSEDAVTVFESLRRANVALEISLRPCKPYIAGSRSATSAISASSRLFAVLYGPKDLGSTIGNWLTAAKIYLQKPSGCKLNLPYYNPQKTAQHSVDLVMTGRFAEIDKSNDQPDQWGSNIIQQLYTVQTFPLAPQPILLRTQLHKHQQEALSFMLAREMGWNLDRRSGVNDLWRTKLDAFGKRKFIDVMAERSYHRPPPAFCGGLLADEMGLGKTCSMLALIASDISNQSAYNSASTLPLKPCKRPTLIVVPLPLLQVWEGQIKLHFYEGSVESLTYYGTSRTTSTEFDEVDVVITTYETVSRAWRKQKAQHLTQGTLSADDIPSPSILNTRWHRIILDEAHVIKNKDTDVARSVTALQADRKWCITGTPIQNRSSDLYSLLRFLGVYPYNDYKTFDHTFVRPWKNNNASALQKLQYMMNALAIRRPRTVISLVNKEDIVIAVHFTPEERCVYSDIQLGFMEAISSALDAEEKSTSVYFNALRKINDLRFVCNHGVAPDHRQPSARSTGINLTNSLKHEIGTLFGDDDGKRCFICGRPITGSLLSMKSSAHLQKPERVEVDQCKSCTLRPSRNSNSSSPNPSTIDSFDSPQGQELSSSHLSSKMIALLDEVSRIPANDKFVVFSFWTTTLKAISRSFKDRGVPHLCYDGSMTRLKRDVILTKFREAPTSSMKAILVSISCGGQGLDLTSANHAYLFEPQWNPMVEEQAVSRVYRLGQQKPVRLCRLIVQDTWEQRIVDLQQRKRKLAELIVDRAELVDDLESTIMGDKPETSGDPKRLLRWLRDLVS